MRVVRSPQPPTPPPDERAAVLADLARHRAERMALDPADVVHRAVLDELISELCDRLIDLSRP